ncbi:MAG: hypothetical protein D6830_02370, partial [Ignavibacteria bacterium]
MKLKLLFFSFLALSFSFSFAQNYLIEHIGVEDGLSQSSVNSIVQDTSGFLWFGTSNGLNRYDGYEFKIYRNNPLDSSTISNNAISAIYLGKNGTLWIGTTDGILNEYNFEKDNFKRHYILKDLSFNYSRQTYYDYPLPISRNNETTITSITEDTEGYIWVGTWGNGLIKYDRLNNKVRLYTHDKRNPLSINFNRITKILVDRLGVIWVATFGGGLNKIIKSLPLTPNAEEEIIFYNYSHNSSPESLSDNKILTLFEDKHNTLWIGTYSGILDRLDFDRRYLTGKEPIFIHYSFGKKPNSSIMSIIEKSDGNIIVGSLNSGIGEYNYVSNKLINKKLDPQGKNKIRDVLSLYEDKSGNIWIGSHLGDGLKIIKEKPFKFKRIIKNIGDGLNDKIVWAIRKDSLANLWIGTFKGGINILTDKGKWKYLTNENSDLSDNHIRCFEEDKYGNIWIGTYSGGLNFYNSGTGTIKSFTHENSSLPSNQIQSIKFMGDTLWIGTFGGGLRFITLDEFYKRGNLSIHSLPGEYFRLSDKRIYTIVVDKRNRLLVGTFGGGVNILDLKNNRTKLIKSHRNGEDGLTDNRVLSIHPFKKGFLIGTYGGGLNYYNEENGRTILLQPKDKNKLDAVYGIVGDDEGNIWLSSDNGIFRYNPIKNNFSQYDIYDGLQSMEFSGGAYFKDNDGIIYFGGIKGLNYFNPKEITNNDFIPPVVITSIKIFDKELKGNRKKLELRSDQNYFSFQFASLDFTSPVENRYAYIMEGFDKEWHFTSSQKRFANYTNLEPGDYIFRVKATNNDGVWNEKGTEIAITIIPPFYATWWFITLLIVVALSIIGFVIWLRFKQILAIEKLKAGLAADLHDNIGS